MDRRVFFLKRTLSDGTTRSIEGKAVVQDKGSNAKLRVRFNGFFFKLFSWLIKANYWVLAFDDDYRYVVVGTPNRDYLDPRPATHDG